MNLRDEIARDIDRTGSRYLAAHYLPFFPRLRELKQLASRLNRLYAELDALTPAEAGREVA
jgi:hypothetical protein